MLKVSCNYKKVLLFFLICMFFPLTDAYADTENTYTYVEMTRSELIKHLSTPSGGRDYYINGTSSVLYQFNTMFDNCETYDTPYIMYIRAQMKEQTTLHAVTWIVTSNVPITTYHFQNTSNNMDNIRVRHLCVNTNRMIISAFYNSILSVTGKGQNNGLTPSIDNGVYYIDLFASYDCYLNGFDYVVETFKLVDEHTASPTPEPTPTITPTPSPTSESTATPTPSDSPAPSEDNGSDSNSGILASITDFFSGMFEKLSNIIDTIKNVIGALVEKIIEILISIKNSLSTFIDDLLSGIQDIFTNLFTLDETYFDFKVASYNVVLSEKLNISDDKSLNVLKKTGEGTFEDISGSYDGAEVKFVDFSHYKKYQSVFRKWVDGFFSILLVLYNMNQLLFMIRGTYIIKIGNNKKDKDM